MHSANEGLGALCFAVHMFLVCRSAAQPSYEAKGYLRAGEAWMGSSDGGVTWMQIGACLCFMLGGACRLQLPRLRLASLVLKWAKGWHGKRKPGPSLGCCMAAYC